jgi:hypothetical protein
MRQIVTLLSRAQTRTVRIIAAVFVGSSLGSVVAVLPLAQATHWQLACWLRMTKKLRKMQRVLPALGLFVGAPLVAEFLLGNLPITMIGALVVLAPMYGGGALLIRETVRRAGRGWPSIFLLALAYGVLEEGIVMQSLFNPKFLGLNQHLQRANLPAIGIDARWTVFVLTLHAVWSISVPIAIVEALAPGGNGSPWLSACGLASAAIVFLLGCFVIAILTARNDPAHFVASPRQFAFAAFTIAVLMALALRLPRRATGRDERLPRDMRRPASLPCSQGPHF